MPAVSIVKNNSLSVSYSALTDEGKEVSKKQAFDLMPLDATDQDFLDLGTAIGSALAYGLKEILKNNTSIITEG